MTPTTDPNAPRPTAGQPTHNVNVAGTTALTAPRALKDELPVTDAAHAAVVEGRDTVRNILQGTDERFLVIVGPCSIHDPDAAREYAQRLAELKQRFADRLYIVMRVYFEKPRTTVGWKGLINDPHLDGSFDIQHGLRLARGLLVDITSLGLPTGTEMLDPYTPQYIDDLVSWASIGARTTESQTHRQMASGLSMPVGFKNATDGNLQIAIDAMTSARSPHHFLGIDDDGNTCVVETRGNTVGHVILRGGRGKPNYHPENIKQAAQSLQSAGVDPVLMVDCSHANSDKQHQRQEVVWNSLIEQRNAGNRAIIGAMLESNLHEGKQSIPDDKAKLTYGVSVTDACIGWDKTEQLLREGHERLRASNRS
ncbi:MAG: 3-deoxy-7-phosphoheptulonate synthase [Phycisphaeraceae bacterium]